MWSQHCCLKGSPQNRFPVLYLQQKSQKSWKKKVNKTEHRRGSRRAEKRWRAVKKMREEQFKGASEKAKEEKREGDRCETVKREGELHVISHAGVTLQHHRVCKVAVCCCHHSEDEPNTAVPTITSVHTGVCAAAWVCMMGCVCISVWAPVCTWMRVNIGGGPETKEQILYPGLSWSAGAGELLLRLWLILQVCMPSKEASMHCYLSAPWLVPQRASLGLLTRDHGLIVVLCCLICRLVRKKRGEKRKRRNTWRREKLLHSLSQTVFTWALLRGIESKRIQPHPWVQVLLVNGNCHNLECR